MRGLFRIFRITGYLLGGLVALLIAAPYLIPQEEYLGTVTQHLSEAVDRPVEIEAIRLHLLPLPGATLEGVSIGGAEPVRVDQLHVPVELRPLWGRRIVVSRLELEGVRASKDAVLALGQIGGVGPGGGPSGFTVEIRQVQATGVRLRWDRATELGPYAVTVTPHPKLGFARAEIREGKGNLQITLKNQAPAIAFNVRARNWRPPLGPAVTFRSLDAHGRYRGHAVDVAEFQAKLFDGVLKGKARLEWPGRWRLSGNLAARSVDTQKALAAAGRKVISGRLDADCDIDSRARAPHRLADNPSLNCAFRIRDGVFFLADLEKAASITGYRDADKGTTRFELLSGRFRMRNKAITVSGLKAVSEVLEAEGKVLVSPQRELDGHLDVAIKKTGGLAGLPLLVAGTVDDPTIRPTNEALAGGAAGTAILGPGLGTAIGIKAGEALKGIKKLFGGD